MYLFYEWSGRVDEGSKGKRFHQVVRNQSIDDIEAVTEETFALIGFECDEGVRRNKGNLGAAQAPNSMRKQLASIPYHSANDNVIDLGNLACRGTDLEGAQAELGRRVAKLIEGKYTPIILGGGHETLYGHYLGVRQAVGKDKKIGIINLDAHLDMRLDQRPSSGTMFRQILEADKAADYLCVGLQTLGNTEELFKTANTYNVKYILQTELSDLRAAFEKIDAFAQAQDVLMYTICTDVINQAAAPGVSAPAPFGIQPETLRALTRRIVNQSNFISLDVSEVNPKRDIGEMTSRLMSYVISEVMLELNLK